MTPKYVTASRARHVTFPRVFPIGLWGVEYSLFIIYSCLHAGQSKARKSRPEKMSGQHNFK